MSNMLNIRLLNFDELHFIHDLAFKIWPTAYRKMITREQINYMLEKRYNMQSLNEEFYEGAYFFLAEENDEHVGFAAFNFKQNGIYRLEKLYVLSEKKGQGIGKMLLQVVVDKVNNLGGQSIQLNVNRKNEAVDFYVKMGFEIIDTVDLPIGNGFYMNDYIMELLLE
jgi:GNAT superfamily N-acetyltransferase